MGRTSEAQIDFPVTLRRISRLLPMCGEVEVIEEGYYYPDDVTMPRVNIRRSLYRGINMSIPEEIKDRRVFKLTGSHYNMVIWVYDKPLEGSADEQPGE